MLKKHKATFDAVQKAMACRPRADLLLGPRTDFGQVMGDFPTIPSLATPAWDCRRPEKFREQLIGALVLYDRGDLELET